MTRRSPSLQGGRVGQEGVGRGRHKVDSDHRDDVVLDKEAMSSSKVKLCQGKNLLDSKSIVDLNQFEETIWANTLQWNKLVKIMTLV